MPRTKRTHPDTDIAPAADAPAAHATTSDAPAGKDRLTLAEAKLQRMQETNKLCFKHQNDFPRIEEELKVFKYSDAELEHILEPKGQKMIPGFGYSEIERQKQYVNFLKLHADKSASHAERIEQSRTGDAELQR